MAHVVEGSGGAAQLVDKTTGQQSRGWPGFLTALSLTAMTDHYKLLVQRGDATGAERAEAMFLRGVRANACGFTGPPHYPSLPVPAHGYGRRAEDGSGGQRRAVRGDGDPDAAAHGEGKLAVSLPLDRSNASWVSGARALSATSMFLSGYA